MLCKTYYLVSWYAIEDYAFQEIPSQTTTTVWYFLVQQAFYVNTDSYTKTVQIRWNWVKSSNGMTYVLRMPWSSTDLIKAQWTKNGLEWSWSATLQPWEQLDLYFGQWQSSSTPQSYWTSWTYVNANPHKVSRSLKIYWFPNKIISIWKIGQIAIFWVGNWSELLNWITEILTSKNETTTEATAWSITPANFVWYIKVWDYKIPYYN